MALFDPNHGILSAGLQPRDIEVYLGAQKAYAMWCNNHIVWPFPDATNKRISVPAGLITLPTSYAYCLFGLGGGGGGGGGATGNRGEGGRAGAFATHVLIRGVPEDDAILAEGLYATVGSGGAGRDFYSSSGDDGTASVIRLGGSTGTVLFSAAGGLGGKRESTAYQQNGGNAGSYQDPEFLITMTANGGGTGNGGNATIRGCGGAGGNQQFLGNNKGGDGSAGEIILFYL